MKRERFLGEFTVIVNANVNTNRLVGTAPAPAPAPAPARAPARSKEQRRVGRLQEQVLLQLLQPQVMVLHVLEAPSSRHLSGPVLGS